jgi:quinol-cytochrome oxidoreductase complex cytochrome b subunit
MIFDRYVRRVSIVVLVCAAAGYLAYLVALPCNRDLLAILFMIVLGPALVCALVLPVLWRLFQRRPIERKAFVLAGWAVIANAFLVTIAVMAPTTHGCFS